MTADGAARTPRIQVDGRTFDTAACDCEEYTPTPYPEGPDPDEMYDRMRDDR